MTKHIRSPLTFVNTLFTWFQKTISATRNGPLSALFLLHSRDITYLFQLREPVDDPLDMQQPVNVNA